MVRGPCKFTQREITRVAKGLKKAGFELEFDVKRFTFTVVRSDGEKTELTENEWEQFVREESAKKRKPE